MGTQNRDVVILVVSCDAYQDLWQPFFHAFFRCWADCPYPVYLGSNHKHCEHPRVQTISVGEDRDYSSNLLAMLSRIDAEWVLVFVEDVFITSPIDTRRVKRLVEYCQKEHFGNLQLLSRRFHHNRFLRQSKRDNAEIIELPVGVPYRVSINVSLWNKQTLTDVLRPGESAWQLESQGTMRSFQSTVRYGMLDEKGVGPLFLWVHGIIKRRWTWEAARYLKKQKTNIDFTRRSVQPFSTHIYLECYTFIRHCAFWCMFRIFGLPGMMKLVSVRRWR